MVIGLSGHMESGKDTVARMLSAYGYRRAAFGDALRSEVAISINARHIPDQMPGRVRAGYVDMTPEEVWAKPTSERCRRVLQWWGTEYRRAKQSDYWVAKVRAEIHASPGLWVISDVRFPDEAAMVRDYFGGVIWRIERESKRGGIPGHISEHVHRIEADVVIDNNSTFDALRRQIAGSLTRQTFSISIERV